MMALVGYARVSSTDQDLTIQKEQLSNAGCKVIFAEKESAVKRGITQRPQLDACLRYLREGDVMMVTRLDRLARSGADFYKIMAALNERSVMFKALLQPEIDTTTANGRLVASIFAAMAEFEAAIRGDRQREGIERAKREGRYDTRKSGGYTVQKWRAAKQFMDNGFSYRETAFRTGISVRHLRRKLPQYKKWTPPSPPLVPNPPSAAAAVEIEITPAAEVRKAGVLGRFLKTK